MTTSRQQTILYLLDRPCEPFFFPKGNRGVVFDVPNNNFMLARFREVAGDIEKKSRMGNIKILVENITFPDLSDVVQLGRTDNFSLFVPLHRNMAARLITIFMGMRTFEGFVAVSVYARDRVNPNLFVYALSVAVLHRPDTKDLQLPSLAEIFPGKYVDRGQLSQAREVANVLSEEKRKPLEIPLDYTATDLEPEHRVAYFREDLGVNLHHWHWHLVYPGQGPSEIINKDRRGELFYYMHQQVIARYNIARLCERLDRVRRLTDLREPIEEGYFPKLDSVVASRVWAPRPAGAKMSNLNRKVERLRVDLSDIERWMNRIVEAIHVGRVIDTSGNNVELTEMDGIDVLGNMIEPSDLSVNRNLYGSLHNSGHDLIALTHDPDHRHLEQISVMGDVATAMRDPAFYRWHATIDDIFQMHKRTLPRYTPAQLEYQGIRVTGVEVNSKEGPKDTLLTYWEKNQLDLSRGIDFAPRGSLFTRFTQLQHAPFSYKIQVENNSKENRMGTVRIFLAPKFDESGQPMLFDDQRLLMVEMDKFQVTIKKNPKTSTIDRDSSKSSITIPFERTFRDLEDRPTGPREADAFNFCGCGWPEHMLVPKGTAEGYPCQLFVMVSNIADDRIDDSAPGQGTCAESSSFCGIRDKKYPDKRSMGFPFDRLARAGVETLQQFITPNMAVKDVKIMFSNRVELAKSLSSKI